MAEIQRADIAYRRRVVRTLVAVAILLALLVIAFQFWLRHVGSRVEFNTLAATIAVIQLACVASITLCLAALGIYLLVRGARIVAGRRFPPRDVRIVRETPVREGDEAVRVGRMSQLLGLVLIALGLIAAVTGWIWLARW